MHCTASSSGFGSKCCFSTIALRFSPLRISIEAFHNADVSNQRHCFLRPLGHSRVALDSVSKHEVRLDLITELEGHVQL